MSAPAIRPLNASLQVVAREQLFEETDKIQEHLDTLKEWIRKSAHLRSRTDDQFLVTFLRGCKYSLEMSKKKLDMYYTLRTHIPGSCCCFLIKLLCVTHFLSSKFA